MLIGSSYQKLNGDATFQSPWKVSHTFDSDHHHPTLRMLWASISDFSRWLDFLYDWIASGKFIFFNTAVIVRLRENRFIFSRVRFCHWRREEINALHCTNRVSTSEIKANVNLILIRIRWILFVVQQQILVKDDSSRSLIFLWKNASKMLSFISSYWMRYGSLHYYDYYYVKVCWHYYYYHTKHACLHLHFNI